MTDKALHAVAGFIIALALGVLISPHTGLAIAALIGVAKEVWDFAGNGDPDIGDIAATAIGGGFGAWAATGILWVMA